MAKKERRSNSFTNDSRNTLRRGLSLAARMNPKEEKSEEKRENERKREEKREIERKREELRRKEKKREELRGNDRKKEDKREKGIKMVETD